MFFAGKRPYREPGASSATREPKLLAALLPDIASLEVRVLGRTFVQSAIIGVLAGLMGVLFFLALEYVQTLVLERLAGYHLLRAHGEKLLGDDSHTAFRPWLLVFLPAIGALLSGLVTRLAPEARGGGGNAMIDCFHNKGGAVRPRTIWVKALASIFTLGFGGAGGREGPTMQMGGALGSTVGTWLGRSKRERRVLMVAGVAAGISAVFRTPIGAALLAIEVLYRDDFESEALIPAVLSSVLAYSIVISLLGKSTLFLRPTSYSFDPIHIPLYAMLAAGTALLAIAFSKTLRLVESTTKKLAVPDWLRPAIGGLMLGVMVTPIITYVGERLQQPGLGLGILGGGYGAAQVAISGAQWLPSGWTGVQLLLLLCIAKLVAASLTIGSGGSAGDFAPSLALGALFGGAFGRSAQLLFHDNSLDPSAFALVGMGTFYGGIAHVPLSSVILVCELAGSYDLLIPLMLSAVIAFLMLRKQYLYPAQVPSQSESPVHRQRTQSRILDSLSIESRLRSDRPVTQFEPRTPAPAMVQRLAEAEDQDIFPVVNPANNLFMGIVPAPLVRVLSTDHDLDALTIAADVMQPFVTLFVGDNLGNAAELMLEKGYHVVPVIDRDGRLLGLLEEADVMRAYLEATEHGVRA